MNYHIKGLREALNSFSGVLSHELHESELGESNDEVSIRGTIQFSQDSIGSAERLLVLYALKRTRSNLVSDSDKQGIPSLYLTFTSEQAAGLTRALRYASELEMSEPPSPHAQKLGDIALPILLSHCLTAFTREYSAVSSVTDLPSLPVWSNMLRVLGQDLIPQTEINKRAIISTRTRKVVMRECESLGWIETRRRTSGRTTVLVKLTDIGVRVNQTAERRIEAIENRWKTANSNLCERLHSALEQIVRGFELEYPYYITGYGPADDALTGGPYLPAERGPPRIPARGEEWPVILRDSLDDSSNMPMSALLSQALAGFAIEYEMENLGRLGHILSLFRYIGNEGVRLESVRSAGGITGNGRSLHERHMNIVLEPGKPTDNSRTVYLAPKARRARDSYSFLVYELESRWRRRYGEEAMNDLRDSLEALSKCWLEGAPDYPNTTSWMLPWYCPYKVR